MFLKRFLKPGKVSSEELRQRYLNGGRIPWSEGYKPYRMQQLQATVKDQTLLDIFSVGQPLAEGYGYGLDERIVEYPWVLSRLNASPGRLLDAGSTLNYPYLLDLPRVAAKNVIIMTLAPENMERRENVSYIYGDLRDILFRENVFSTIVCISTLEHVGLDNTQLYTDNTHFQEDSLSDYRKVLTEIRRVLAPGGQFLLTVPFGRAQNFGWMQQFDPAGLSDIIATFGSEPVSTTYFQYLPTGWVVSDANACSACEYFDVHSATEPASDRAAAARAVACLEFTKPASADIASSH